MLKQHDARSIDFQRMQLRARQVQRQTQTNRARARHAVNDPGLGVEALVLHEHAVNKVVQDADFRAHHRRFRIQFHRKVPDIIVALEGIAHKLEFALHGVGVCGAPRGSAGLGHGARRVSC